MRCRSLKMWLWGLLFLWVALTSALAGNPEGCLSGNCPRPSLNPYPETGLWFDPNEPGTGFVFEVQGGILAGFYFGYDAVGESQWYLISGTLMSVEDDNSIQWRLTAPALLYTGGRAITEPYVPLGPPISIGEITIDFSSRNRGAFSINGSPSFPIQSFSYGSSLHDIFQESGYKVPDIEGQWVLVYTERSTETTFGLKWAQSSLVVRIESHLTNENASFALVQYLLPEVLILGNIECVAEAAVLCSIDVSNPPMEPLEFTMPLESLSDDYFYAVGENGDTLEGLRLNYD